MYACATTSRVVSQLEMSACGVRRLRLDCVFNAQPYHHFDRASSYYISLTVQYLQIYRIGSAWIGPSLSGDVPSHELLLQQSTRQPLARYIHAMRGSSEVGLDGAYVPAIAINRFDFKQN